MFQYSDTATIFVSQKNGNDSWSGYEPTDLGHDNGPLRSLDEALSAVTEMRRAGVAQPIRIAIEGDYFMQKPVTIGAGTGSITFTSYPGTRATINGGRVLTGFARDHFNGRDCFSLFIPDVKDGKWLFTDLYVDGKRARPARYPEKGTLEAVTTEFPKATALFNGSHWFIAKKEDLAKISCVENATVNFYHYWIDEHTPIKAYDPETGRIDMKYRSCFEMTTEYERDISADFHYYLENIPEGFLNPGDWFLDVKAGMLYYLPADPSMTPESIYVTAPEAEKLFNVEGTADNHASDVHFVGLDFHTTRGECDGQPYQNENGEPERCAAWCQSVCGADGAISFKYADECSIENCRMFALGLCAASVNAGCSDIRILNNNVHDFGASGIRISGGSGNDLTTHVTIHGNRIKHGSQRYAAGCGVLLMHSSHNEISDNEIAYTDYTGVSVGWCWGYGDNLTHHTKVLHNHIHHIGQGLLSDMGGIYTLGKQPGTVLDGNVIHDVSSNHYGGWGIYTDEGSSYELIQNNLVYRTKTESFHQHYGSFNTVRNNIFAQAGNHVIRLSRHEKHLMVMFEDNVFITDGKPIYCAAAFSFKSHGNRICDTTGKVKMSGAGLSLTEWQAETGLDEHSVEEVIDIDVEKLAAERIAQMAICPED